MRDDLRQTTSGPAPEAVHDAGLPGEGPRMRDGAGCPRTGQDEDPRRPQRRPPRLRAGQPLDAACRRGPGRAQRPADPGGEGAERPRPAPRCATTGGSTSGSCRAVTGPGGRTWNDVTAHASCCSIHGPAADRGARLHGRRRPDSDDADARRRAGQPARRAGRGPGPEPGPDVPHRHGPHLPGGHRTRPAHRCPRPCRASAGGAAWISSRTTPLPTATGARRRGSTPGSSRC